MDRKQWLESLQKEFISGAETEVRIQSNSTRRVVLSDGALLSNLRVDESGVCARVRHQGSVGFASIPEQTQESLRKVLEQASHNAETLRKQCPADQPALPAVPAYFRQCQDSPVDLVQARYIERARQVDEWIQKSCPSLLSRRVILYCDTVEKQIANSEGTLAHILAPRTNLLVLLIAQGEDGNPVSVFNSLGGLGTLDTQVTDDEEIRKTIDQTYHWVLDKAKGVPTKAGMRTCILSGLMTGMLAHEAVGHTVEADLVQAGSVAGPLLGQKVASEKVSLVDFAHTALGKPVPLPVYVDDEGVEAQDVVLIEKGILKGYMHDRASALRHGVKPTGNARAWLFSDEPLIRMRNTAVLPGTDRLEDLIASVEEGYYLIQSTNGQADLTGEFTYAVSMGYEIKNGKLGRALRDTTVSGTAFEMLKTVDGVSDSLTWSNSGFCGKKQIMTVSMGGPELRCQIMIGGE